MSWLPHALDKTFGTFTHSVDSFQEDSSVVAHSHNWLVIFGIRAENVGDFSPSPTSASKSSMVAS